MSFDKKYFEFMCGATNFERRYEKNWHEAECDGDYKSIGLLHYDTDKNCRVQVWNDKITGKKRWWFGFSFKTKKLLTEFCGLCLIECLPHFDEKGFEDDWLMKVISEKWKVEDRFYLGIYSKRGMEDNAISIVSAIANKFDEFEYLKLNRKYGEGEGKDHKELKQLIYDNPELIGLTSVKYKEMEYPFEYTGDRVDLLFILETGEDIVVEIETNNALPGCHQAVKYRSLRCAEQGRDLDSGAASCVVAWKIPEVAKNFCKQYGIAFHEIKP